MSMKKLAEQLHVLANGITQRIASGSRANRAQACTLLRNFPSFWLGMHKDYDLPVVRDEFEAEVGREDLPNNKS
jgi:plasmid maintenance system antidote protein VapI